MPVFIFSIIFKLFMIFWGSICFWRGAAFLVDMMKLPEPAQQFRRLIGGLTLVAIGIVLVVMALIPDSTPDSPLAATLKVTNGVYMVQVTQWQRTQELLGKPVSDAASVWLYVQFESSDPLLSIAQLNSDFSRCGVVRDITGQIWNAFAVGKEELSCVFVISRSARGIKFQPPNYPPISLGF